MKVLQYFGNLFIREIKTYRISNIVSTVSTFGDTIKEIKIRNLCFGLKNIQRRVHADHEEYGIDDTEFDLNEHFGKNTHFRNMFFSDSKDEMIIKLNNSASVKNVMDIINEYENVFTPEHITQAILVLKDLQIVYYSYNGYNKKLLGEFNESLRNSEDFQKLLQLIKTKLNNFDESLLSDIYLLINEFGILAQDDLMQDIALKLSENLQKEFRLDICAKLFDVLFRERSIRPYYISLKFLPKLISSIDTCNSLHQFRELTACLIKIQRLLTEEVFDKYKKRVEYFLKTHLKGTDYQVILDITMLLGHPNWRHRNTQLISTCLLLIKNEIDLLNISELVRLYEIFYKNQEPGELLNNIQRVCAKFLRLHEEKECCDIETNLKLFSAFIYFTSSSQRTKFRKDIEKYVDKCHTLETLSLLKRLLSYVKISNRDICERYWNMSLQFFDTNKLSDVVRLCQNYISFNTDIPNYRHFKFEKKAFECIESALENEEILFASGMAVFLSFCLRYNAKDKLLSRLIDKLENNVYHMQPIHYIVLAEAMDQVKNTAIPKKHLSKMRTLMNAIHTKFAKEENHGFSQNILLIKALVIQNQTESYTFESCLYKFKEMECISSKFIENVCTILSTSNSLVPEIINKCTEYVVNNPDYVIAFNVDKLLYLCYALAYYPVNDEKFFKTATNIILRDQERLSGLSILQIALSLSFFNQLPVTLIKQIFTIEFMDNLDTELENCYSKDRYPQRVRSTLMQLNRVVCLEYPEYNIPWFHQKYVEELQKRGLQEPKNISLRIAEYLSQVFDKNKIFENVITPYGYHIDFALSFDNKGQLVSLHSGQANKRLALLLMKPHSYTRFYKHLKGRYQLKNRHLEILGYDVRLINQNEWSNLLYASERLDFLRDLVKYKDEER